MLGLIIGMVGVAVVLALVAIIASRSGGAIGGGDSDSGLNRLIESLRDSSERSKAIRIVSEQKKRPDVARVNPHDQRPVESLGRAPKPLGREGLRSPEAPKESPIPRRTYKLDGLGIPNKRY